MAAVSISNPNFPTGSLGRKKLHRPNLRSISTLRAVGSRYPVGCKATPLAASVILPEGNVPKFTCVDGIHRAEEKIGGSRQNRRETKINSKSSSVEEFPAPPTDAILRRFVLLFASIFPWSFRLPWYVMGWPALLSLAACIYFLTEKTGSVGIASRIGLVAQVIGMVKALVVLRPTSGPQVLASLVVHASLFLVSTFLK